MTSEIKSSLVLGGLVCAGLVGMGAVLGSSALKFKAFERVVSVKALRSATCRPISRFGRFDSRPPTPTFRHSNSRLGKIKTANQGQFTIEDRDTNTAYIKKVRVVSTVEYYLSD